MVLKVINLYKRKLLFLSLLILFESRRNLNKIHEKYWNTLLLILRYTVTNQITRICTNFFQLHYMRL